MRSKRQKMKLETQRNNYCVLCLMVPPDPERDDNLCSECGHINDKYSVDTYKNQLNLESEDGWTSG